MTTLATIRSREGVAALAGHLPTPAGAAGEAVNAVRRRLVAPLGDTGGT